MYNLYRKPTKKISHNYEYYQSFEYYQCVKIVDNNILEIDNQKIEQDLKIEN